VRNRVATAEPEPRRPDAKIGEADERGPDDQVALIPRQLGCPFSRHLDLIALFDHRQVDPLPPLEGEPKAVEARSEVGAGGWNLHRDGRSRAQHLLIRRVRRTIGSLERHLSDLIQQPANRSNGEQIGFDDFGMNRAES
jgi:hypothetical protein